jgi:hypothetical protein
MRPGLLVAMVLLGIAAWGAYQLNEHRGAIEAARLMDAATLPGDEVPCSRVSWAAGDHEGRCATTTKDASSVADEFIADLRGDGVERVESTCGFTEYSWESCIVEAHTSFRNAVILIIQARFDESNRFAGMDMEIITKHPA